MLKIPAVSLCMIVKNEAEHLHRCLSSIQGLVAEIIIGDTGSNDGTIAVALGYGARVIKIPWENDFAKARNLVLRQASQPWILVLDADEAVWDWQRKTMEQLLGAEHVHGYFLPFIHYVGGQDESSYVTDNVCRLFRNDERICFGGSIHEEAASSIWAIPGGQIAYADLPVKHYGYLEDELQRKHKSSRNLKLIHDALKHDSQSVSLRYALGTEYYQQGQYSPAADILLPLLDEAPAGSGYAADIYLKTAYALQACGRRREAKDVYVRGTAIFPDFTDLVESYALLLLEEGLLLEPYNIVHQALKSGNTAHKYPSSSGSGTSRTSLLAGQICERLLLYEEAKDHYEQAIRYAAGYAAAWDALVPLCLLSEEAERLVALTREHASSLSAELLGKLVPAALNAHMWGWLQLLSEAPLLPPFVRHVLQVPPGMISREHSRLEELEPMEPGNITYHRSAKENLGEQTALSLECLLQHPSEQPFIHGYLWAWSCRTGDEASAARWLECLAAYRPGLLAVSLLLETGNAGTANLATKPPAFADLSYAAQLLLQVGAWSSLLTLYEHADSAIFRWCCLPQPLLCGLLQAPNGVRKGWCSVFEAKEHRFQTAADAAEWLLYAAVAGSCGLVPQLEPAAEHALKQTGSTAVRIGLSYLKLQLAAQAYPQQPVPSGRIPPLLLVRSALLED